LFFFQAEDGIRDRTVTGVQTCALPIYISNFNDVLEVNTEDMYALVEPSVSMDRLVKATLEYGLLPPVVMEFPGITAGGAVNGAKIGRASCREREWRAAGEIVGNKQRRT